MTYPDNPTTTLQQHLLPADATLRTALAHLNAVEPKLCIMVDHDGAAMRTCSDGDIRRGLLGGATLESPLVDLPYRAPVLAGADTSDEDLLALMSDKQVSTIVLTDGHQRPVELKNITDLQDRILLSPPHIGTTEVDYVRQTFDSNWIAPAGLNIEAFESRLAEISTRNHAIAVSSGRSSHCKSSVTSPALARRSVSSPVLSGRSSDRSTTSNDSSSRLARAGSRAPMVVTVTSGDPNRSPSRSTSGESASTRRTRIEPSEPVVSPSSAVESLTP